MGEYNYNRQKLKNLYGEPFLRYICGAPDEADVDEALAGLPADQWRLLCAVTDRALAGAVDAIDLSMLAAGHFTANVAEDGKTLAQQMRLANGGDVGQPRTSVDPLADALLRIAYDSWPALLVRSDDLRSSQSFAFASYTRVEQHPAIENFCNAVMMDPDLSILFPGTPDIAEVRGEEHFLLRYHSNWIVSGGSNFMMSLVGLAGSLIFSAAASCEYTAGPLTYEILAPSIVEMIKLLRQFANWQETRVPTITGLQGIRISDESSYEFEGLGILRKPSDFEMNQIFGPQSGVSAVFAGAMPICLIEVLPSTDAGMARVNDFMMTRGIEVMQPFLDLEAGIDQVRLALLLASPNDQLLASGVGGRFISNLSDMGSSASLIQQVAKAKSATASDALERAQRIFRLLKRNQFKGLSIAHRRLLDATSARWDPVDAFVDAVIVWENVFGSQGETTFRVTASMALLLEPNRPDERRSLHQTLKKLYSTRSSVVHGSKDLSHHEALKCRDAAVGYAIELVRTLYEDRADLIPMASNSRGEMLLLRG